MGPWRRLKAHEALGETWIARRPSNKGGKPEILGSNPSGPATLYCMTYPFMLRFFDYIYKCLCKKEIIEEAS